MKKKLLTICVVAICIAVLSMGTSAYFTTEKAATNVITTGSIEIKLHELTEQGGEYVPFEDVGGVMPGAEISKIAFVENTGFSDAWVRIRVEKNIDLAVEGEVELSLVSLDYNTEHWTERDGYYYYNQKLSSGAKTEPLFTTVIFAPEMGNLYQNSIATVEVTAQAVQVANNGESAFEAAGWAE